MFGLEKAPESKCYEQVSEWNFWFIDVIKN